AAVGRVGHQRRHGQHGRERAGQRQQPERGLGRGRGAVCALGGRVPARDGGEGGGGQAQARVVLQGPDGPVHRAQHAAEGPGAAAPDRERVVRGAQAAAAAGPGRQGGRVHAPAPDQAQRRGLSDGQGHWARGVWRGAAGAEARHGQDIRHEDSAQERDDQKGPAGPRARRARRPGRVGLAVGGAAVLFVPGPAQPVPDHGVSARRRPDDHAHQVRHIPRGRHALLHGRVRAGPRGRAPPGLYPPRHQARQHPHRQGRPHQAVRLWPVDGLPPPARLVLLPAPAREHPPRAPRRGRARQRRAARRKRSRRPARPGRDAAARDHADAVEQGEAGDVEAEPPPAGVLDRRNPRLHCARDIPAAR
ncbi:hypothetical protein H4R21_006732, partial [Coemansia helicoidea]